MQPAIRCGLLLMGLLLALAVITARAAAPHVTVQTEGVSGELLKNVLAYLSINTYRDAPNMNPSLVERLNARAPEEIKKALEPFGYYQPDIKSDLQSTADGWLAHYIIVPGKPVTVRNLDVSLAGAGENDAAFMKYLAVLQIGRASCRERV